MVSNDMKKINDLNYNAILDKSSGIVSIVYFSAIWCAPCKKLFPIFEEIATTYCHLKIQFFTCDVEESPNLSCLYSVLSIPTIILFKDKRIETIIGLKSKERLLSIIIPFVTDYI